MLLKPENFHQAFESLGQLLCDHRALWGESAFTQNQVSWKDSHPDLYKSLVGLSEEDLASLDDENDLLTYLTLQLPRLGQISEWTISSLSGSGWQTPARGLFGLPKRKKHQTEGFVTALLWLIKGATMSGSIVDWCSGRGLLARQLQFATGLDVLCLEYDSELCQSGRCSNQKLNPMLAKQVAFSVQDVRLPIEPNLLKSGEIHTALHACGNLHMSMLSQTSAARVPHIACSPCCYHSIHEAHYQPLSLQGRHSELSPTRNELRLATAELCTANTLERNLRQRELLWRIAFDIKFRQLSGVDQYRPTPSVKKSLLKGSFNTFFQHILKALTAKGHPSLSTTRISEQEEANLLHQARGKLSTIRRLEKAQLGFRRALEYWLLLDRALFLQEQGYKVELKEFCKKRDSGRNIVILAKRID